MSSGRSEPVLSVRDLNVSFRTRAGRADVVNGLNYDVHAGQTLAIVGESGSGKSVGTLALMGLLPSGVSQVEGQAIFDGGDLLAYSEEQLRKVRGAGVGMVFQDPMTSLNPVLTVERQIVEALRAHGTVDARSARRRTVELLDEVGIPDPARRAKVYPHQLSGGMRQRVMIAIALAGQPQVLIADEATTALDVTVQAQIIELIARVQQENDTAVIWITHDLGVVAGIADHVLVMYAGRCVEEGSVDQLFHDPRHPYTRGLLGSVPVVDDPRSARQRDDLATMPGLPPDPTALPAGCAFYPRCPIKDPTCRDNVPWLRAVHRDKQGGSQGDETTHRAATYCGLED
ncbi:MAG TPA: ABC transporter ATP-binding protein [Jiangellaceae bacterium]|nr:ABC transporter ATP-binding protein [Jiangellaceae bacterium]